VPSGRHRKVKLRRRPRRSSAGPPHPTVCRNTRRS